MNGIDMRKGSITKNIISFSIPLVLTGILQCMFNAADMIVVGQFSGSDSLAAVGSTASISNTLTSLFMGLSVGTGVVTSYYYGADDERNISKTLHTAFLLSGILGILLMIAGLAVSGKALELMDTPGNIFPKALLYLRIYFLGMPAMMIYNFMAAVMRATGDTKTPLLYLTASGITNVVFNIIFVVIFHMDVAGVAWATILSQYLSAILITFNFTNKKGTLHLSLIPFQMDWKILKKIINIGLPAGIQSTLFGISNFLIQSSVNYFGAAVIAGNAAAVNITNITYIATNSIYQTTVTMTSQNYGFGNYKRIKQGFRVSLITVTLLGLSISIIFNIFGIPLLSVYTDSPDAVKAGLERMYIVGSMYFLCGIMECFSGVIRGMGKSVEPLVISLLGTCAFRIMWTFTVFEYYHTLFSVYIAYPVSWFITIVIYYFVYRRLISGLPIGKNYENAQ